MVDLFGLFNVCLWADDTSATIHLNDFEGKPSAVDLRACRFPRLPIHGLSVRPYSKELTCVDTRQTLNLS